MSIIFIISSFFLFFFFLSVFFPVIPPGQIIMNLFGDMQTEYLIGGISADIIFSALINGIIWSIGMIIVYSYFRGPQKNKNILPVWIPGYATSRSSRNQLKSAKLNGKKTQIHNKNDPIESIVGINHAYKLRLREVGVRTVGDLKRIGLTPKGRKYLANTVGVSSLTIRKWINQVEM